MMSHSIQKILVTGATGFLGRHICQTLRQHHLHVRALVMAQDPCAKHLDPHIEQYQGDIGDETACEHAFRGCDAIIHAAGKTNLRFKGRQRLWEINVQGTDRVCRVAKRLGISRLVHVSSIGVLGAHPRPIAVTEDQPAKNAFTQFNTYHRAKYAAEMLALNHQTPAFEVIVMQPCMIWGEGDWLLSSTGLARHAARGHHFRYPRQGGSSLLHVTDAASGIVAGLLKGQAGERYLLAGDNFTNHELFSHLYQSVDPKYQPRGIPAFFVHLSGWVAEGLNRLGVPLDYSRDMSSLCDVYWWGDSQKAKKALAFQPHINGIDVIRRTVAWHLQNPIYTRPRV